jgi:hypothetical protein
VNQTQGVLDITASLGQPGGKPWTAPVILEALIPGRMQSHAGTAEVPRGAA